MGAAESRRPPENAVIGEGAFGVVYLKPDGNVMKKGKQDVTLIEEHTQLGREMRAFDWIDHMEDKQMQSFFARRLDFHICRDNTFTVPLTWARARFEKMDSDFHSVPLEERDFLVQMRRDTDMRNKWLFTYELTRENKGRAIDSGMIDSKKAYKALVQVLRVIQFMTQHDWAHVDLHRGNFLIQPNGDIALIDYGEMYTKGDDKWLYIKREYLMLVQLVGLMIDIDNNFSIEGKQPAQNITSIENRVDFALRQEDVRDKLLAVCDSVNYADPIGRVTASPRECDLLISLLFDTMKAKHPDRFRIMMGFPPDASVHTWFQWRDIENIYDHLDDIPGAITHFESTQLY
jgi:hypothetical protein